MSSPAHGDRSLRWMAILGTLVVNAIAIAFVVAINSGAAWLELVYRFVVLAVGAVFVWPVCADAVSQMRSNHRDLAGGGTSLASLWDRLLVYVLTLLPAFFSLALLSDFVRSWFMPAVIGENPMLIFLLLLGPHAIRNATRRKITQLVYRRRW